MPWGTDGRGRVADSGDDSNMARAGRVWPGWVFREMIRPKQNVEFEERHEKNGGSQVNATILQTLSLLERQMLELTAQVEELSDNISGTITPTKDWYTTAEVAAAMKVTWHTVQERWCNQGRIACEKDGRTGKWRVPGYELERLRRGGRLDVV